MANPRCCRGFDCMSRAPLYMHSDGIGPWYSCGVNTLEKLTSVNQIQNLVHYRFRSLQARRSRRGWDWIGTVCDWVTHLVLRLCIDTYTHSICNTVACSPQLGSWSFTDASSCVLMYVYIYKQPRWQPWQTLYAASALIISHGLHSMQSDGIGE